MFSGTSSDFMEKFNHHACNFLLKIIFGDETEKLEERQRERGEEGEETIEQKREGEKDKGVVYPRRRLSNS